jgi:hypothetical protein
MIMRSHDQFCKLIISTSYFDLMKFDLLILTLILASGDKRSVAARVHSEHRCDRVLGRTSSRQSKKKFLFLRYFLMLILINMLSFWIVSVHTNIMKYALLQLKNLNFFKPTFLNLLEQVCPTRQNQNKLRTSSLPLKSKLFSSWVNNLTNIHLK